MARRQKYGVLRYQPGGIDRPGTTFDGWYSDKVDAEGQAEYWREAYSGWLVYVIQTDG